MTSTHPLFQSYPIASHAKISTGDAPTPRHIYDGNVKNPPTRWAAVIHGVREVTLTGAADLAYWRDALRPHGLIPFDAGGSAELTISAPKLVWNGMRFREWSLGVFVSEREDAAAPDGLFLAHAFNSSAALAFAERAFFSTPYFHAAVDVAEAPPVRIAVTLGSTRAFCAQMSAPAAPVRVDAELWEGPVFLPRAPAGAPRKYFIASLGGETQTYAFNPGSDVLELAPAQAGDAFAQLRDSRFAAREWHVRHDATHRKSRTLSE